MYCGNTLQCKCDPDSADLQSKVEALLCTGPLKTMGKKLYKRRRAPWLKFSRELSPNGKSLRFYALKDLLVSLKYL